MREALVASSVDRCRYIGVLFVHLNIRGGHRRVCDRSVVCLFSSTPVLSIMSSHADHTHAEAAASPHTAPWLVSSTSLMVQASMRVVTAPLDRLRTLRQVGPELHRMAAVDTVTYRTLCHEPTRDLFRHVVATEGYRGLFRSTGLSLAVLVPQSLAVPPLINGVTHLVSTYLFGLKPSPNVRQGLVTADAREERSIASRVTIIPVGDAPSAAYVFTAQLLSSLGGAFVAAAFVYPFEVARLVLQSDVPVGCAVFRRDNGLVGRPVYDSFQSARDFFRQTLWDRKEAAKFIYAAEAGPLGAVLGPQTVLYRGISLTVMGTALQRVVHLLLYNTTVTLGYWWGRSWRRMGPTDSTPPAEVGHTSAAGEGVAHQQRPTLSPVPDGSTRSELMRDWMKSTALAVGGLWLLYPLDTVRRRYCRCGFIAASRMAIASAASTETGVRSAATAAAGSAPLAIDYRVAAVVYPSAPECVATIYKAEGLRAFWRGNSLATMRTVTLSAMGVAAGSLMERWA